VSSFLTAHQHSIGHKVLHYQNYSKNLSIYNSFKMIAIIQMKSSRREIS